MLTTLSFDNADTRFSQPKTVHNGLFTRFQKSVGRIRLFFNRRKEERRFFEAVKGITTPLVESETEVVFIAFGRYKSVRLAGDFNGWEPRETLSRIKGTTVWFKRLELPPTARVDYKLVVDGKWITDPLNPARIRGGYGDNSELVMSSYRRRECLITNPSIPHGTLDTMMFESREKIPRRIAVYLPPDYSRSAAPYPVIFFHDGIEFLTLATAHNTLDYCIHHRMIRPVVGVFVEPRNRMTEYWDNEDFARFFASQIVPFVEARFNVSAKPNERAIMGVSLGGLMALKMAFMYPEIWGNAAGLSSAIQIENGAFVKNLLEAPKKNLRLYLDCGTFERLKHDRDFFEMNKTLAAALAAKGYPVLWQEYHEGHSWGNWRAHVEDVLKFFFA